MRGLHENALQRYYDTQAPARMPCRTNHVDKALIKRTKIRANSSRYAGTPSSKAWTTC